MKILEHHHLLENKSEVKEREEHTYIEIIICMYIEGEGGVVNVTLNELSLSPTKVLG